METTTLVPVFFTREEVDYWVKKLSSFLYEPEISSIHKKLETSINRNFISVNSPEYLMQRIYKVTGYTKSQIDGKKGKRNLCDTRFAISAIIHEQFPKLSLSKVGSFTNKEHSTVLHHYKMVTECEDVRSVYEELKIKLNI